MVSWILRKYGFTSLEAFTSSKIGKNFINAGAASAAVVGLLAQYTPHTFLLNYTRENLQLYDRGKAVKVDEKTLDLISEVYEEIGVRADKAKQIKWFTVIGFDPINRGTTYTRSGSLIGLPRSISYQSTDDVESSKIKLHMTKSVPWDSEEGAALKESLVLSENAKRFIIAREVKSTDSYSIMGKSLLSSASVLGYFYVGKASNTIFNLRSKAFAFRGIFYLINAVVVASMYKATINVLNTAKERTTDDECAKLGDKYVAGGLEYYAKTMQRNRALLFLLGEQGKRFYSHEGNRKYWILQPSLPLSGRKDFFAHQLHEIANVQSAAVNVAVS